MSYKANAGDLYRATVTIEAVFRADPTCIGGTDCNADQHAAFAAGGLLGFLVDVEEKIGEAGHPLIGMDAEVTRLERLDGSTDVEPEWERAKP